MPQISWQELDEIKHSLSQAEDSLRRRAEFIHGLLDMIDEIVTRHEDEI